jgi:hypothetical protein
MFFQLSLPTAAPATESAGDSVLQELDGAGTLTVPPRSRPAGDHVARLLAVVRGRDSRDVVHCRVAAANEAALTFTSTAVPGGSQDPQLQ